MNEKINAEVMESEVVEETESKTLVTRVKEGVKKNGKKIVKGVAIGAGLLFAYALGKKAGSDDSVYYEEETIIEIDDADVETEEE